MASLISEVIKDVFKEASDKKIEDGVVGGFSKVIDKCVEVLFAREGESVEEAKARLSGKDKA